MLVKVLLGLFCGSHMFLCFDRYSALVLIKHTALKRYYGYLIANDSWEVGHMGHGSKVQWVILSDPLLSLLPLIVSKQILV